MPSGSLQKGITTKSQMIFTQENEYSAVLDACVLVPAALNDFLLRLAEEPAMYRPLWSEQELTEMTMAMRTKLHRTVAEVTWRKDQMCEAFPEAMVTVPTELLRAAECVPDENDRHVLAAAIMARANTIVTQNTKHFPKEILKQIRRALSNSGRFSHSPVPSLPPASLGQVGRSSSGDCTGSCRYSRDRKSETLSKRVWQARGGTRAIANAQNINSPSPPLHCLIVGLGDDKKARSDFWQEGRNEP